MISRRGLISGLISLVAAPAIVRAGSLMPVKVMPDTVSLLLQSMGWEVAGFDHYGNPVTEFLPFCGEPTYNKFSRVSDVTFRLVRDDNLGGPLVTILERKWTFQKLA